MKTKNKIEIKKLDIDPVEKVFDKDYIPIAFSSSDYFVPYLSVALRSILEHSGHSWNYDIIIFNRDITEDNKTILNSIFKNTKNFSLRFISMPDIFMKSSSFAVYPNISVETYFRLIVPEFMKNYDKVLFLDSDLVITDDLKKLYDIDIMDKPLGACHESLLSAHFGIYYNILKKYYFDKLKFKYIDPYFQAGVMIINVKVFNENNYSLRLLNMVLNFRYAICDQDALNELLIGNYFLINKEWNYTPLQKHMIALDFLNNMSDSIRKEYLAVVNPKIIHYADKNKPWVDPEEKLANIWWKYARNSPYYEVIIYRMCCEKLDEKLDKEIREKRMEKRIKLFGLLPILKIKKENQATKIKFLIIPLLKIHTKNKITRYKLFNFIPILKVKEKRI